MKTGQMTVLDTYRDVSDVSGSNLLPFDLSTLLDPFEKLEREFGQEMEEKLSTHGRPEFFPSSTATEWGMNIDFKKDHEKQCA